MAPAPFKTQQPASAGPAPFAAKTPDQERAERLRKIARASMDKMEGAPGAGDLFGDSVTLGLQKPVGGLAGAIGGELGELFGGEPAGFGERYTAETGAYQDRLDEATANSGWAGTGANVAGSLMTGGPARGVVQSGLWPMVKSALGFGAVEGAARNAEDPGSAVKGALTGAATAGATTTALGTAGKVVGSVTPSSFRSRRAERIANRGTPPNEIKAASRAAFHELDNAGVAYSNQQSGDLVDDTLSALEGYDATPGSIHSPLHGVIARLESLRGQPVPLSVLKQVREQIGSAAGANEPQVRRIAGQLLNGIDGFVTNEMPAMSQIPGDQVAPLWANARRLWQTANAVEDIGWRLDKAGRRSRSTNSGTNVDNPIRQNIRSVVDKSTQPGRRNPYSPDVIAQMERVVEGSPAQNMLRGWGNRFGGSGPMGTSADLGLGSVGGLGALVTGAEPSAALMTGAGLGGALWASGKAARSAADRMSENAADDLVRLISEGGHRAGPVQGPPTRANLAALMRQQALLRGSGVYAGGEATR